MYDVGLDHCFVWCLEESQKEKKWLRYLRSWESEGHYEGIKVVNSSLNKAGYFLGWVGGF